MSTDGSNACESKKLPCPVSSAAILVRAAKDFIAELAPSILEALGDSEPPPIHAQAGKRALQLAYAAIESFQTRRRVQVAGTE